MDSAGKQGNSRGASTLALGALIVAVVAMLVVPLPTWLVDLLITLNLGASVTLLLAAGYARSPLSIATFPTLLVLTTLFRLALNVSTVRLILLQADAGQVVRAFGAFVVRGDYVVGGAVFLILTIVQYVVIARGAERVAEVAARFTLDAMPGRQLAIDADLRARAIDPAEARRRRAGLQREAQLYGALDGAMRFVKGDAIAAIAILAISLVGGLAIGSLRAGLPIGEAARLYTLLTIGDGLASQIPALLVATAAGLLVTRVSADEDGASLGAEVVRQLLGEPRLVIAVAGLLGALALLPGMPLLPFAASALAFAGLAIVLLRRNNRAGAPASSTVAIEPAPRPALQLELPGARAADAGLGGAIERALRALADDLGVPVPPLSISAGAAGSDRVVLRLRGAAILDENAASLGSPEAIARALARALARGADRLVGIDETELLVDSLSARCPALCREVVPRRVDLPTLAEVLRRLLAESVPIGDLRDVLEALARIPASPDDAAARDPADLVEQVRRSMAPRLSARLAPSGRVSALLLDPLVEDAVREAIVPGRKALALEPAIADDILATLAPMKANGGPPPVLLVPGDLRAHLARLVLPSRPDLPVVAFEELSPDVEVVEAGRVTPSGPAPAPRPDVDGTHA
jgi:type III secretion protein V